MAHDLPKLIKIVLTGAPSAGKSSVVKALQEVDLPFVTTVPETARLLLSSGYPVPQTLEQIYEFQRVILSLQKQREDGLQKKSEDVLEYVVLDRSGLDGAAFWPHGMNDYLNYFHLDLQTELSLHDHVLFLELPEKQHYGSNDKNRFHNYEQSLETQERLRQVWSGHPRFQTISAYGSLEEKVSQALLKIVDIMNEDFVSAQLSTVRTSLKKLS